MRFCRGPAHGNVSLVHILLDVKTDINQRKEELGVPFIALYLFIPESSLMLRKTTLAITNSKFLNQIKHCAIPSKFKLKVVYLDIFTAGGTMFMDYITCGPTTPQVEKIL